jgi:long-chain acyl-CoA synthetase
VIIDRAKDVGAMQDGTPFAPQFIENKLKYSPFVREAVCFGNDRPFVVAMVAIDMNTVGSWAERNGVAYTSYMDLSQKPEVRELVVGEVPRRTRPCPRPRRCAAFSSSPRTSRRTTPR